MKEDQRIALTKRLLREGLLRLLKLKDISKISVTELCAEAGINRATFYRHYQQPKDIIGEIRHEMFYDVRDMVERVKNGMEPEQWLERMCQYFYDRAELLNLLFRCRTDDEFVALINEICREHFETFRKAGVINDLDADEFRLMNYCFSGGVYYILRQWITEPIDKTPREVAGIISRFLAG